MVHILNNTVDGSRQFPFFIQGIQVMEVAAVFVTFQGMLDILGDSGIDIPSCIFIIPKHRVTGQGVLIAKGKLPRPEGSPIADIQMCIRDRDKVNAGAPLYSARKRLKSQQ